VGDQGTARKRPESPAPPRTRLSGVRGRLASDDRDQPDGLIHHRLRLGVVSALAAADAISFNELKVLLKTTDGNLSVHARKLEDAGYVTCTKTFESRRPRTEYRLAPRGRRALERYLSHMEALIRATRDTLSR
jgi:DNA-binding MarR family transcriptional regulator